MATIIPPTHPESPPPHLQPEADPRFSTTSAFSSTTVDPDPNHSTPRFSTTSATPVLEKDEEDLDFTGSVDVDDHVPSEKDMARVADLFVLDAQGQSRKFRDVYSGEGRAERQLVVFIRHFFCGNCQEYLRTLSSSIIPESLLALPTPTFITVIGCGRPELIDMYAAATSCPFPIYADPTRKLYSHLSLTRTLDLGPKPSYMHSNLFITSVQSVMQGLKTGSKALKGGDFKQVGGEFLFEEGRPVWVHRMRNTRDHTEIEDLRGVLGLEGQRPPLRKRWSHGVRGMEGGRKRSGSWGRLRSLSRGMKDKDKEGVKGG